MLMESLSTIAFAWRKRDSKGVRPEWMHTREDVGESLKNMLHSEHTPTFHLHTRSLQWQTRCSMTSLQGLLVAEALMVVVVHETANHVDVVNTKHGSG